MKLFLCVCRAAIAAPLVLITCFVLATAPARASGTAIIRQSDGHVNIYYHVAIKIIHSALFVTSPDKAGTLVIYRAACSYQQELMVCFANSATLIQSGNTKPIDLKTGTLYFNDTGMSQPLTLSSKRVPPHSIMLSLTTKRGTYVSLDGRVDQVVK